MPKREPNYLIVGGTSGIGLALVEQLAHRGQVVIWSRQVPDALPENLQHFSWDVTSGDAPPEAPHFLDGLAYCPGTIRLKPLSRITDQEFHEDFEINCMGAVRTLRTCLSSLRRSDGASVVLFSTVAVSQGMPMHTSIAAAKGAVEGLTRSLAAELAPRIRVNAIAPSLVDTPLSAALIEGKRREAAAKRHPLQRIGNAEETASLAFDLMTGRLSWMTGQILHLDGGMSSIRLLS